MIHRLENSVGRIFDRFVLPNPDNCPAGNSETRVGITVPLDVRLDLVSPELAVRFRPCRVLGASVPEAPIDEDRHTKLSNQNVGLPSKRPLGSLMNSVAKPTPMKLGSETHLSPGVAGPLPAHPVADRLRRCSNPAGRHETDSRSGQ